MIAAMVGCGRPWVNKCIGVLEQMKWLKRLGAPKPGGQQRYALGTQVLDKKKPAVETFWALTRAKTLMDAVAKVQAKQGRKAYWEDRPELVRGMLLKQGVTLPKLRRPAQRARPTDHTMSSQTTTPLSSQTTTLSSQNTPPVVSDDHPLSSQTTTPVVSDDNLNREHLNREPSNREPSNTGARDEEAVASLPADASGLGVSPAFGLDGEDLAGADSTDSDSPTSSQSSGISESAYRDILAAYVGDGDGGDAEDEGVDEDVDEDVGVAVDVGIPPEDDGMGTQERQAAVAAAIKGAVTKTKTQQSVNEAKRKRNGADKQREKNLSGAGLEKHIPKGSIAKLELVWRKAFEAQYPEFLPARWWTAYGSEGKSRPGKEAGLVSQLVQMYSLDQVQKYLVWAVKDWPKIVARFPTKNIGFREALLPEALKLNDRESLETQLRTWYQEHSGESPPAELLAKLKALKAGG
jgi:hypothetical protein